MKFSIKDIFSKCDQNRRKLWIWSHLLQRSLMENFIFCAVTGLVDGTGPLLNLALSLFAPSLLTLYFQKSYWIFLQPLSHWKEVYPFQLMIF